MALETIESSTISVSVQRLPHAPGQLPGYATSGAAGMDIPAAIDAPVTLQPMERALIPTGLIFALPEGYECQIRARSGLAIKHGIALINGIGTIDSDYRHEVKIALVNLSTEPFTIQPGDRIAQAVIAPVTRLRWREVETLSIVEGRNGGFGSTGVRSLE
jgi:dUTP pyrophosphatase